jgi:hypothetical protein
MYTNGQFISADTMQLPHDDLVFLVAPSQADRSRGSSQPVHDEIQ